MAEHPKSIELASFRILYRRALIDICKANTASITGLVNFAEVTNEYPIDARIKAAIYLKLRAEGLIIEELENEEAILQVKITQAAPERARALRRIPDFQIENEIYILHLLYRLSHGNSHYTCEQDSFLNGIQLFSGILLSDLIDAIEQLERENLIEWSGSLLSITERGMQRVEQSPAFEGIMALEDNNLRQTQRDDAGKISQAHTHIYNAPVGSVFHGDHNQANVHQQVGVDSSEVLHLVAQLRRVFMDLPTSEQAEVQECLDVLEGEISSPTRNAKTMKMSIAALTGFAHQFAGKLTDGSATLLLDAIRKHLF